MVLTDIRDPSTLEDVVVDSVEPLDLFVLEGYHVLPTVGGARARGGPSKALGVGELVGELGAVDQKLLWDTSSDYASESRWMKHGHLSSRGGQYFNALRQLHHNTHASPTWSP